MWEQRRFLAYFCLSLSVIQWIDALSTTITAIGSANFTVPSWVISLDVTLYGATGGSATESGLSSYGGIGGMIRGNLAVTPGETLRIYIGGQGSIGGSAGGVNGGGRACVEVAWPTSFGGGGGATDIRRSPYRLTDRLAVAGGGGGAYAQNSPGGNGGYTSGLVGVSGKTSSLAAGGGGGPSSGGSAGYNGVAGSFGQGGACGTQNMAAGGGGGYWGGGSAQEAGAGGGSSFFLSGYVSSGVAARGDGSAVLVWISAPTSQPSSQPSGQPVLRPSCQPSRQPSTQPTSQPINRPTSQPSLQPLSAPTGQPSSQPSVQPTCRPSAQPSNGPTSQPSHRPSTQPTSQPTQQPSDQPSRLPTTQPTTQPSGKPSLQPSSQPSSVPTDQPSRQPSLQPSGKPTQQPSVQPSGQPTTQPTSQPSSVPSAQPSTLPTSLPSAQPSAVPSLQPTSIPSAQPSSEPSVVPTGKPSSQPTACPSTQPSGIPSLQPSARPTTQPTSRPSVQPSMRPSVQSVAVPSSCPSGVPSAQPSYSPSRQPSASPSTQPTSQPSVRPSQTPSSQPSRTPTGQPSTQPSQQPRAVPSGQPSAAPSTRPAYLRNGEWATTLGQTLSMAGVFYAHGLVWACGLGEISQYASCTCTNALNGALSAQYQFDWRSVVSLFTTSAAGTVVISGGSNTDTRTTHEVAVCTVIEHTSLHCFATSFYDAKFLAASYVPYPDKIVHVGWNNVRTTITMTDVKTGVVQSYLYTASNMKALTLSQIQSPPNFLGCIVAGTAVRATATPIIYIVVGMFRTDGGSLRAMVVMPVSGDILNSADLVNAMALEYTGPDSFIAGGLQLADIAGTHAYLLRANALFNTISYCVRYTSISGGRRALSTATAVSQSIIRGMVRVDNTLFMIVDNNSNNITALTVLKTSIIDGSIYNQVHVTPLSSNTNLHCTDIAVVNSFLSIVCTRQWNASAVQSVVLLVDQALSFTTLPSGFVRSEEVFFEKETLAFQRAVLSVTQSPSTLATSTYEFTTVDQSPTRRPSLAPSYVPTLLPSSAPSGQPSSSPTAAPSVSARPTSQPSSAMPTISHKPTVEPTVSPTKKPSAAPTARPSFRPTVKPSARPTDQPTVSPTTQPSASPTGKPTRLPSAALTRKPTCEPTRVFTNIPSFSPTLRQASVDSVRRGSNTRSFVVGASVGGGLGAMLLGYVLYKVYEHYEEKRARALRKIDYMKKQALLAIQRDAEIAKYVQDEEDRNTAFRLQEEQEYQDKQQRTRVKKNKTRKSSGGAGAYATGSVQLPSPAVQQDSADRALSDESNYSISTLHSSEMSSALYDATHYTTKEEKPAVVGEQHFKAMEEGSAVPSSSDLSDFAESIIGLSDSHKSDSSSEISGEDAV